MLGPECLADVLGDVEPASPPARRARDPMAVALGAALAVAVVATLFPWTKFGSGSRLAGAWALDGRWSTVPAYTAVLALVARVALAGRRRIAVLVVTGMLAGVGAAGALMAILNPPPFTKPAPAPWVALAGNAAAAALALVEVLRARTRRV